MTAWKSENIKILKASDTYTLAECLKVREKVFIIEKGVSPQIEIDEYDCISNTHPPQKCDHFIVKFNDLSVGTVRCLYISENTLRIQRLCFLDRYRGQGFGKCVMQYLENYYKALGIKTIELNAKYEAAEFYRKCGYQQISAVFIEANVEHIKMQKEI